jgi:hypothetical protein
MNEPLKEAIIICAICEKQLSQATLTPYQPSGGVMFTSGGNYGSTVFDPMNEPFQLLLVICDECVKSLAKKDLVKMFKVIKRKPEEKWYTNEALVEYLDPKSNWRDSVG